ncbi:MAG TPA: hypothetical protein VNF51_00815 [Candidatus Paceibacterota bacterium]|nr:hypothetical protein [Candidatus Paceibacterota bacterium]
MNDRKIELDYFEAGSGFHTNLTHQMNRAEFSAQGHERVTNAMQAAIEHIAKKNDLRFGVGGGHLGEIEHYLNTKYEDRHDLLPKEREFITSSLEKHFGAEKETS